MAYTEQDRRNHIRELQPCNVGCHCQRLSPADSTGGNTAASLYTRAGIVGGWRNRAAGVGAAKHLENAGGSLYKYSESTDYRHL